MKEIGKKVESGFYGYQCDWCSRYFASFKGYYIVDDIIMCPICYAKEFRVEGDG